MCLGELASVGGEDVVPHILDLMESYVFASPHLKYDVCLSRRATDS
jgi:hypothetical protein